MAKRGNSNAGCAGLLVLLLPVWLYLKVCGHSDQEHVQAEIERTNQENARAAQRQQRAQQAAAQAAAKKTQEEDARAAKRAELAALQPYQRVQIVQQCAKDECPDGTPNADVVIEAAKTPAERKQLQALNDRIEKAQERLSASLRCCDGTASDSCTCGNPHRGCCSRHGGVCGCSADAP